jgi:Mg2+ and Co2+ transporter CorA
VAVSELLAVLGRHLSVTDIVLLLGIIGVFVDRVADARGWSRSSKTLRRENTDLLRRNGELEATIVRHETEISGNKDEIARLAAQVDLLKSRDQEAVLAALERHEVSAERRTTVTGGLLTEIRDALVKNGATT